MERSETFFVTLVDFSTIVQQMMQLQWLGNYWAMLDTFLCIKHEKSLCKTISAYHVQLFVSGCKVNRGSSAIILSNKIRVTVHDLCKLLRIAQAHSAVKCNGRVFWYWRIPAQTLKYKFSMQYNAEIPDHQRCTNLPVAVMSLPSVLSNIFAIKQTPNTR